ncbi:MAG TPA: hypothetical protein HPP56_04220, partial [Nitrospirae bacterium]|nr:hypothetical protein [Nitrospirota bacterium]
LSLKGRVTEKYLPYYLRWVSEGYRFLEVPPNQPVTNEQKIQFLKYLAKNMTGK